MHNQYTGVVALIKRLQALGCQNFVLCPGSRDAPIINAIHQSGANTYNHIDERSAAYVALGLAKLSKKPAAVVCTSGTAVLNTIPAMAEAYYQGIPLVLISADRPSADYLSYANQSIEQVEGLKAYCQFQYSFNHIHIEQIFINHLPIQINVCLEEPLYDLFLEKIEKQSENSNALVEEPKTAVFPPFNKEDKVLVILGASHLEEGKNQIEFKVPTLADACSNLQDWANLLYMDNALSQNPNLIPDVLITYGKHWLSKKWRTDLIQNPPKIHVHIDSNLAYKSPFTANFIVLDMKLAELNKAIQLIGNKSYMQNWLEWQMGIDKQAYLEESNIIKTVDLIFNTWKNCTVHAGNSMSVRYLAAWQKIAGYQKPIIANRGTAGIDGCLSAFFGGCAAKPDEMHLLVIGDISFFYDNNAFWLDQMPSNWIILVINNQGGEIFKHVKGTINLDSRAMKSISSPHHKSVKKIAELHELHYLAISNLKPDKVKSAIKPGMVLELMVENKGEKELYNKYGQL